MANNPRIQKKKRDFGLAKFKDNHGKVSTLAIFIAIKFKDKF